MLPVLFGLGIAATALFISGCGNKEGSPNSEGKTPSDGGSSAPSSTSPSSINHDSPPASSPPLITQLLEAIYEQPQPIVS